MAYNSPGATQISQARKIKNSTRKKRKYKFDDVKFEFEEIAIMLEKNNKLRISEIHRDLKEKNVISYSYGVFLTKLTIYRIKNRGFVAKKSKVCKTLTKEQIFEILDKYHEGYTDLFVREWFDLKLIDVIQIQKGTIFKKWFKEYQKKPQKQKKSKKLCECGEPVPPYNHKYCDNCFINNKRKAIGYELDRWTGDYGLL